MTSKIPTRSEIPESDTWDLSHLFQTEEAYQTAFTQLRDRFPKIAEFRTRLGESVKVLVECLEFEKSLNQIAERLGHYASLKNAEDSSNNAGLSRQAELTNLLTKFGDVASFINPEIQQIPDQTFQRFLNDPVLAPWRIALIKLRRYRSHTLSEREERLLTLGAPVIRGHSETFSQLTNVDMKFGSLNLEGREIELTQGSYFSFLNNSDRDLRRKAFYQFYAEFDDHKYTLASALSSSVRGNVFLAKIRSYPSAREASLFHDNVPLAVYDNLIGPVRRNLPVLHEYYELRKEILQLAEIHQYDTFVPMVPVVRTKVTFDEAIDLILKGLQPLGDGISSHPRQWIEIPLGGPL